MPKAKPKPAAKPWPDRVRALLERYGWTHAELASRIGVARACVTQYSTGQFEPRRSVQMLLEQLEEAKPTKSKK